MECQDFMIRSKGTCRIYLSTKDSSGNKSWISYILGPVPLSEISAARSPPFKQISPLALGSLPDLKSRIFCGLSKGLAQAQRSFSGATARETAISNFLPLISSARICCVQILVRERASATASTTFSFFAMLSTSWNWVSGKNIASGIPGNPPPVPISITCDPGEN